MHISRKQDFREESVSEEWVEETIGRTRRVL
jgi:hypothetical protein